MSFNADCYDTVNLENSMTFFMNFLFLSHLSGLKFVKKYLSSLYGF